MPSLLAVSTTLSTGRVACHESDILPVSVAASRVGLRHHAGVEGAFMGKGRTRLPVIEAARRFWS
jgi:hypothetical protein